MADFIGQAEFAAGFRVMPVMGPIAILLVFPLAFFDDRRAHLEIGASGGGQQKRGGRGDNQQGSGEPNGGHRGILRVEWFLLFAVITPWAVSWWKSPKNV